MRLGGEGGSCRSSRWLCCTLCWCGFPWGLINSVKDWGRRKEGYELVMSALTLLQMRCSPKMTSATFSGVGFWGDFRLAPPPSVRLVRPTSVRAAPALGGFLGRKAALFAVLLERQLKAIAPELGLFPVPFPLWCCADL